MTGIIIKYRWLIIGFCYLAGLTFALIIPSSETDPEIRNYVPQEMVSRLETDKIEKEFGVQDMVVLLFSDSSIISTPNLLQIKNSDRDISRLTGVASHISLFTVRSIKSSEGMMVVDPVIKRIPSDTLGLRLLKEDLLSNRFARGIVVSADMTTAAITATLSNPERESITLQKIDSVVSVHEGSAKVLAGGLPYVRRHIMKDVRKDALILVPLALLIMLLVLKLTLGQWRSVFMPFSVVVLSASVSMGLIPLFGWKLSIMTLLVPIILIAVANNYGIYLVARYRELQLSDPAGTKESLLGKITGSLNMPILFSGLTTVAGIAGLLTHSIIPARQVGILAAIGVSAALLMSLFLIPAMIYTFGRVDSPVKAKAKHKGFETILNRLSDIIVKYPGRIITISIVFTVITALGILFLKTETNQEKYFPEKNPIRQASAIINEKFGGSQTISVMVSGDIVDPAVMAGIDNLTNEVRKIDGVGDAFSISEAVREMSKAIFSQGESGYDKLPLTREGIAQLFELYNMSGDPDDFKQLKNLESTKAHILIRLSRPDNDVIKNVKAVIAKLSPEIPAGITTGGYAIIMADFAGSIIKGQFSSLLFALITVALLLSIIFRSFKGGVLGSVPLFASILIVFGFMGFAGIALDAATALLSSIMIGVGVDFTIQYIWCFRIQIMKGSSYEASTREAIGTIGRSIIINAFSVMAGFSALMFSGFTSIRFFGYLVIISIGSCLAGALILIPAILIKFRPGFIEKETSKSKPYYDEKNNSDINVIPAAFTAVRAAAGRSSDHE
jgi:hypothetical protein